MNKNRRTQLRQYPMNHHCYVTILLGVGENTRPPLLVHQVLTLEETVDVVDLQLEVIKLLLHVGATASVRDISSVMKRSSAFCSELTLDLLIQTRLHALQLL
jgi:hypothetical protein